MIYWKQVTLTLEIWEHAICFIYPIVYDAIHLIHLDLTWSLNLVVTKICFMTHTKIFSACMYRQNSEKALWGWGDSISALNMQKQTRNNNLQHESKHKRICCILALIKLAILTSASFICIWIPHNYFLLREKNHNVYRQSICYFTLYYLVNFFFYFFFILHFCILLPQINCKYYQTSLILMTWNWDNLIRLGEDYI